MTDLGRSSNHLYWQAKAHEAFDVLWIARRDAGHKLGPKRWRPKRPTGTNRYRTAAYGWLGRQLGKRPNMQISDLTIAECRKAIELCNSVDPITWETK